jgi:hypothetical protein
VTKKLLGKIYDARGDDVFFVNATEDGDVVQIQQYDSIRHTYSSIDFFAATAPKLIGLIQKAAGIVSEEMEYEYAVEETAVKDGRVRLTGVMTWGPMDKALEYIKVLQGQQQIYVDYGGKVHYTYKLVRRPKPAPYEIVW